MPDDSREVVPAIQALLGQPGANGIHSDANEKLSREIVLLRARCSNLRHWCRRLLEDHASDYPLSESTVNDLLTARPAASEAEGQEVVEFLARGAEIPSTHPLASEPTDALLLQSTFSQLSVEHERLRQAFFTLYDHLYPGDDLNDEYFLAQMAGPRENSISELIAKFEHEPRANS